MSRKSILASVFVILFSFSCFAAEKPGGEVKRMSIFISNFTEVGLYDLVTADLFTNAGTGGFLQGEIIYGNQSFIIYCQASSARFVIYISFTGKQFVR